MRGSSVRERRREKRERCLILCELRQKKYLAFN
jgi:hypothetical protein